MLALLKHKAEKLRREFEALVSAKHPGRDQWDWYRALEHAKPNPIGRANPDRSRDAELVADRELAKAHDAYIAALHAYYRARDGEHGVLGGV